MYLCKRDAPPGLLQLGLRPVALRSLRAALSAPHAHDCPGLPGRLMGPTSPNAFTLMCGKLMNTYLSFPLPCINHNAPGLACSSCLGEQSLKSQPLGSHFAERGSALTRSRMWSQSANCLSSSNNSTEAFKSNLWAPSVFQSKMGAAPARHRSMRERMLPLGSHLGDGRV